MLFTIETERLFIRILAPEDLACLREIWGSKDVMCYCGGPIVGENRLCRSIQYYQTLEASGNLSAYAVLLKGTETMIGVFGFTPTAQEKVYDMVFHFDKCHWRQGYATEAGKAIIAYLTDNAKELSVTMLSASIASTNYAAIRVLDKCGFEYVEEKWYEDTKQYEPYFKRHISKN